MNGSNKPPFIPSNVENCNRVAAAHLNLICRNGIKIFSELLFRLEGRPVFRYQPQPGH